MDFIVSEEKRFEPDDRVERAVLFRFRNLNYQNLAPTCTSAVKATSVVATVA
jgi:hypothetical protein